jgi:surfactin synthase thioesterase subunit
MPSLTPHTRSGPSLRLLWFHHAGGNADSYRSWARLLPSSWQVVFVEYPGRGAQASSRPCREMRTLGDVVEAQVAPLLDRPYALFGHSMGSLVAFDLTRRLQAQGYPLPVWLGVSGRHAPHRPPRSRYFLHRLSDEALLDAVGSLGGTPLELLRDAPERVPFLERLRADLEVCETYQVPSAPAVSVPMAAYTGAEDLMVPPAEAQAWGQLTYGSFRMRRFPGGHFYLSALKQVVARAITEDIAAALEGGAENDLVRRSA